MTQWWPWATLALLGAYHGVNPGMGWLFAVARGLQERRRGAVLESLLPIAIGHEAAIGLIVLLVGVAQVLVAPRALRIGAAAVLLAFAVFRLIKQRAHPRGFGMRVGLKGLAAWSFLMSSAHGAGLMLVPILLQLPSSSSGQDTQLIAQTASISPMQGLLAATLHTAALLLVMATVAIVVYDNFGVGFLRKAWFNLDLLWVVTLLVAGAVTLVT